MQVLLAGTRRPLDRLEHLEFAIWPICIARHFGRPLRPLI